MTILLFGVSNVGKSTIGELIAHKLNFDFYDLDTEIKKKYHITLEEFVSTGSLRERDQKRCQLLRTLVKKSGNKVIAVTPLSYAGAIVPIINSSEVFSIELIDTPENIFSRLVFSNENDIIYRDDDYKNAHKEYYLSEIQKDLVWYGSVYQNITNKFFINGKTPLAVTEEIIHMYHLT